MNKLIENHLTKYPQMQVEDVIKLMYQHVFGGGHLVNDINDSYHRLKEECSNLSNQGFTVEEIGNDLLRVYLGKNDDSEIKTINQLFVLSSKHVTGSLETFISYLNDFKNNQNHFNQEVVDQKIKEYEELNYPPISHSQIYRDNYNPHYRVIKKDIFSYYPVVKKINDLLCAKDDLMIAIDGRCGAGKTTLGNYLKEIYDCNLFCLDDFFLQPFQRTKDRLNEPGGNVDYERFKETVIDKLVNHEDVDYQKFDCSKMQLANDIDVIKYKNINIIEGSYSMHPYFNQPYDLTIALNISYDKQIERILKRNGPVMVEKFKEVWIPLEEKYFNRNDIFHVCDIEIESK